MVLVVLAFCAVDGTALLARRPLEEAVLLGSSASLVVALLAKTVLYLLAHAGPGPEPLRRPGRPSGIAPVRGGAGDVGIAERG